MIASFLYNLFLYLTEGKVEDLPSPVVEAPKPGLFPASPKLDGRTAGRDTPPDNIRQPPVTAPSVAINGSLEDGEEQCNKNTNPDTKGLDGGFGMMLEYNASPTFVRAKQSNMYADADDDGSSTEDDAVIERPACSPVFKMKKCSELPSKTNKEEIASPSSSKITKENGHVTNDSLKEKIVSPSSSEETEVTSQVKNDSAFSNNLDLPARDNTNSPAVPVRSSPKRSLPLQPEEKKRKLPLLPPQKSLPTLLTHLKEVSRHHICSM